MLESIGVAVGIFLIRVIGNSITTIRLVMLARDRDVIVFILSFLESLTFAVAIGAVVSNLSSPLNLIAYSGGYAIGSSVGIWLERKLTLGYVQLTATSTEFGQEIAIAIRESGFGATEVIGHGANGQVVIVESVVERSDLKKCIDTIQKIDAKVFITTRTLQSTRHGFIPAVRPGLSRVINRPR